MDSALIASAGLIGLLGAPHCSAMCGAPCAALLQRCGGSRPRAAFAGLMGGRLLGYMAGGAAVAAGVAVFSALAEMAPALRPLWAVAHVATLALGAWMLLSGVLPGWFGDIGRTPPVAKAAGWQPVAGPPGAAMAGPLRANMAGPLRANMASPLRARAAGALRAGAAGTLWIGMPCGLLQSALIVAALASTPWQGAAAMGAFAVASSSGLAVFPALWTQRVAGERARAWMVRTAGAMLMAASAWALGHGLWQRVVALCG